MMILKNKLKKKKLPSGQGNQEWRATPKKGSYLLEAPRPKTAVSSKKHT